MKFIALSIVALLSGCGQEKAKSTDDEPLIGEAVDFSGFVQRAFTIKVEGATFNDSEHFYTRFIPDLIMTNPEYKDSFAKSDISVEGEYALERFGGDASVFVSTMSATGHLFQARTDSQGKFTVTVKPDALDETYKARIVVRIGLLIKSNEKTEHYCYLLHSIKSGITLSERSKPIIFDDFKTQLNTYQCAAPENGGLEIPNPSDKSTGGDQGSGTSTTNSGGTTTTTPVTPNVTVSSVKTLKWALPADADGTNVLRGFTYVLEDNATYFIKETYRSLDDGSYKRQVVALRNPDSILKSELWPAQYSDDASYRYSDILYPYRGGYLRAYGNSSLNTYVQVYDSNGIETSAKLPGWKTGIASMFLFKSGSQLKVMDVGIYGFSRTSVWDVNFDSTTEVMTNAIYPPSSSDLPPSFSGGAYYNSRLYLWSEDTLYVLNERLVLQKKYDLPSFEKSKYRLVGLDDGVYMASLNGDNLEFRKLQFNG